MKYAYFTGCVTPQRENAYEASARKVLEKFGIELIDLEGQSCCGFFLGAVDHLSGAALAARNLSLAEETGCNMLTLCPTCSGHLIRVKAELLQDSKFRNSINQALKEINRKFEGSSEVKHLARVLVEDVGVEEIRKTVIKPLKQLRWLHTTDVIL